MFWPQGALLELGPEGEVCSDRTRLSIENIRVRCKWLVQERAQVSPMKRSNGINEYFPSAKVEGRP